MTTLTTNPSRNAPSLHDWLERIYAQFHHRSHVDHDPLMFLYDYDEPADREVVGLIAASLAYGNVKSILRGVRAVLGVMGPNPAAYLKRRTPSQIRANFAGFRYRVTDDAHLSGLLVGMRAVIRQFERIEACVAAHRRAGEPTIAAGVGGLVDAITRGAGRPLLHLLPHPNRGSACKRLMLYLRWMVRQDAIDPGGWDPALRTALIVPLDTHMRRVAAMLRLTERKSANLLTALEITAALRAVCPDDPLRYDFALTRPGILKLAMPPMAQPTCE